MAKSFTGCGVACRVMFPIGVYDQVIVAFKVLKSRGMSEDTARNIAQDAGALAGAFVGSEFGPLAGIAVALVTSGCADCAVDSAY